MYPKGETVGYGATYTADSDQIIATLPIGYADGFIRANQGRKVYVDGQMAEIVGTYLHGSVHGPSGT
jgi:alanine racemase